MTTKADLDSLWTAGVVPKFDDKDQKKAFHEFEAGSITTFECGQDCVQVSFVRGKDVIATMTPPGRMENVPSDIRIVVNGGSHGGRAKGF